MLAKGKNKMIILLIESLVNRLRNFTLSRNETSIAKTDHKNEISAKNWVGSTWIAKVNSRKVNGQSQRWSTVNTGLRSTVNAGQWSTSADVALGLTWQ